jgi:hypothetical protein
MALALLEPFCPAFDRLPQFEHLSGSAIYDTLNSLGERREVRSKSRFIDSGGRKLHAERSLGQLDGVLGGCSHSRLEPIDTSLLHLAIHCDIGHHLPCESRVGSTKRDRSNMPE